MKDDNLKLGAQGKGKHQGKGKGKYQGKGKRQGKGKGKGKTINYYLSGPSGPRASHAGWTTLRCPEA